MAVNVFRIKTADVEDIQAIQRLLRQTWMRTYAGIYPPPVIERITSEWHSMEALGSQIQNPDYLFLEARDWQGKLAGILSGGPDEGKVVLHRLYVHPDFQGNGAGSMLLDQFLEYFEEADAVYVEVEAKNDKAIGFYAHKGFVKDSEKDEDVFGQQTQTIVLKRY